MLLNVPRLSCGNVQPGPCRLLRGRDGCSFQSLKMFARRNADGWFRQSEAITLGLERPVRVQRDIDNVYYL